ncbi:MAG: ankyrin repeat domain-containing protein [Moorea sp. SIO4G2]|uniref:ankyrin repeat domain-containing protein n=1 Tax=unclassified Moorena TaxID=2683338 RepID=UPI0013CA23BD|nr:MULTISPECIES: ankyrin repeat domain-containing protein [unclassified Moorena]NEO67151.1 ankyrin repeat domain-containing protein [Moorena sp. SIO4G2]NEO22997.1 ankyrin repeat domain-containing protein [Moorena sp. SIO4A5]NEO79053.1 ankyrin repeat domain-containing protein [Moorena sp. SIO4G3]NEP24091.1 ankyrin repeat domain-containing protein [Moorena sp. SIO3I6]NEQ60508.1 ankyrin repeat domain-containing protein [Moorena sp. SIO4A1]
MNSTNDLNEGLLQASKDGDLEVVKSLVAQGADVNVKDKENATALMRSVSRNYREIVEFLIEKGADVNAINDWDYTPLKYAIKLNLKEIQQILRDSGAKE